MSDDLRWILLAAGVLLIAGVYLWGLRARRRSAAPEHERVARQEPPMSGRAAAAATHRVEPGLEPVAAPGAVGRTAPPSFVDPLPVIEVDREDAASARPAPSGRREPRIDATERTPVPQKIFALRITAPAATPFDGRGLREAVTAERLEFGRYQVFHRLHAGGEPVFSLASLKEPGTFDPATMDGATYRGVALFAVLPGPVPAAQTFDELLQAAGAIAGRLGGLLQDDRGAALTVARLEQLRAELLAYERSRSPAAGL
jgi:cell division protein ZipA